MSRAEALGLLAANLACRRRLGLARTSGDRAALERLLAGGQVPSAQDLASIRRAMGDCRRCQLARGRQKLVFGQGPEDARLMIVGEAPGQEEDRQGLAFVGKAGQLLTRMLAAVGINREQVYITNIVKCRPPNNRDPEPAEAAACRPFLEAQVRALSPLVILALGRPAAQALLATKAPIGSLRGNWSEALGAAVLPTFHPAYLLRSPEKKAQAYADLKAAAAALRRREAA